VEGAVTSEAAWEDRYWLSRDGLRLHYRDYSGPAEKPPVLCLHGLTRNTRDFEDVAARLAGEWRVVVPDFRGRGLSDYDPVAARYVPPTYASDILQLLDQLEIERAVFIGTSLGGLVTMAVGTVAPQRIAGVVLNDVGPRLDPRGLERIRSYVGQPALFANWDEAAEAIADRHRGAFPGYRKADWVRFASRVCREIPSGIILDYDLAIGRAFNPDGPVAVVDGWPYFRSLRHVPLLVVRGEHSDLLAHADAEAMVKEHPDAQLVTVPGVGHAPDLSEPEATGAVDRLLKRVLEAQKGGGPKTAPSVS
jgi:pimeloyl-ACP methyl ester carboxylesterase